MKRSYFNAILLFLAIYLVGYAIFVAMHAPEILISPQNMIAPGLPKPVFVVSGAVHVICFFGLVYLAFYYYRHGPGVIAGRLAVLFCVIAGFAVIGLSPGLILPCLLFYLLSESVDLDEMLK